MAASVAQTIETLVRKVAREDAQIEKKLEKLSETSSSVDLSNVVQLTGNQTIDGVKTFEQYVIAKTPGNNDDSTKVATTAFVNGKVQSSIESYDEGFDDKVQAYINEHRDELGTGTGGNVVASPVITGSDTIAIGYSNTYTFSSRSLLSGVSIHSFLVTFNGSTQTVSATDNAGSVDLSVPAGTTPSSVLTLSVVAVDEFNNRSAAVTTDITAVSASIDTPVLSVNPTTLYPNAAVTLTGNAFKWNGKSDTHEKTLWQVFDNAACTGTPVWKSESTTDKTSITVPAGTFTPGTVYAVAQYKGASLGYSSNSNVVTITVQMPVINTPTIQSPAEGASVQRSSGVSVVLSDLSVTGGTDTLKQSTVMLYNTSSDSPILTRNSTSLAVSFTASDLGTLSSCRLKAQQEGNTYGLSGMTDFRTISINDGVSAHGCILYPDSTGECCIVEAKNRDGSALKLLVPFAKYRTKAKFGTYGTDNPDMPNCTNSFYLYNNSSHSQNEAIPSSVTMNYLIQNFADKNSVELSAKVQSESWYNRYRNTTDSQSTKGVPAVEHCMNLFEIDDAPFYLGNSWENMILWMLSDDIDEMDKYKDTYSGKLLGKANTNGGRFFIDSAAFLWCSSEWTSNDCLRVYYDGRVANYTKFGEFAVVPLRELAA